MPNRSYGMNGSPYWYYQVYGKKIELDPVEIMKESLIQAVYKWETHDPILPAGEYGCGREAYEMMSSAFQSGDYCSAGASATIGAYAAHKRDLELYLQAVLCEWPDAGPVAEQYAKVSRAFQRLNLLMRDTRPDQSLNLRRDLCRLLDDAKQCEESAIREIKSLLRETIYNRFQDISLR